MDNLDVTQGFSIVGFIVLLLSLAACILAVRIDADQDAEKIRKGVYINHTKEAWTAGLIVTGILVSINLLTLINYKINSDWFMMVLNWVVMYVALRLYFFNSRLNELRGLHRNHLGSGPTDSMLLTISRSVNLDNMRLIILMFTSFMLMHHILNYYNTWHPRLEGIVGWTIAIMITVGVIVLAVKYFQDSEEEEEED